MKNSTVLLWWFLYQVVGILAAMGFGFVGGLTFGLLGLPETPGMILVGVGALAANFFVYKWSVNKIMNS
tara:strand:- start:125 stop:331 length:207 start_codon:yes stop_codon:yes gene_type:complete